MNPFLANAPISYFLKKSGNQNAFSAFMGYKMRRMTRNDLIDFSIYEDLLIFLLACCFMRLSEGAVTLRNKEKRKEVKIG